MSYWGDDEIRYKYDPLPEEAPRHRKKSKKHHAKSDHKHEYEDVAILPASDFKMSGENMAYHKARRCKVCGKLYTVDIFLEDGDPPHGMRVFDPKADDMWTLYRMKYLPEDTEVTR